MKLGRETIQWIELALDDIRFGEVSVIFHLRDGKIEWTEKIKRETEKPTKCQYLLNRTPSPLQ
jgi:hypothetical protein